jgi:hypothetical protein
MGCCSSRQTKTFLPSFDSTPLDSIVPLVFTYRISLLELHLTKQYEKTVRSPSGFFLSFTSSSEFFTSSTVFIGGLHHRFEENAQMLFRAPFSSIKISLFAEKLNFKEQVGSCVIDMDVLKDCRYFKGGVNLLYRCRKTGSVNVEICKNSDENEFMTLSQQGIALTSAFLPGKEYPSTFGSVFSPTPKFNTFTTQEQSVTGPIIEKINVLKQKTVEFEVLNSSLDEKHAEVIFYTCEKLAFYACQSRYSDCIELSKITKVLSSFSADNLVANKALWLLFYIVDSSAEVIIRKALENWQQMDISSILLVWENFHSQEHTILCLELLLKHITRKTFSVIKHFPAIKGLLHRTLAMYHDGEIISPVLIFIQQLLSIPGKAEFWYTFITSGLITGLNSMISTHFINNEVITIGLKLLLTFSLSNSFAKIVANEIDVVVIKELYRIYCVEKGKLKAIAQILSQVLGDISKNKAEIVMKILNKTIKLNYNWHELLSIIFAGFNKNAEKGTLTDQFLAEKNLSLYCEVISFFGNDLVKHEEFIEFLYKLGKKSEKLKRSLINNREVSEILREIAENGKSSGTGSSIYKSTNSRVVDFISNLL